MYKKILLAAVAAAFFSGSAMAQEMSMKMCDDKTFEKVKMEIDAAPDAMKKMAKEHLMMAKEKMDAKMTKECGVHLEKASMAAKKQ